MKKEKLSQNGKAWIKKETYNYRTFILFLTLLTVFSTLFSLGFAYMVRYLINSATNGDPSLLWLFALVLLGLLLLRISLKTISSFLAERLRSKMTSEIRTRTFSKILRSNYATIQKYHSGELLNRLTSDIQQVVGTSVGLMPAIAEMAVQCVGSIVALMTIDPLFTIVYVICGSIFGGLTALFRNQIKKKQKALLQADGEFRSFMQEGVASVMTVKAYGAEGKSTEKAENFANVYYKKRMERNVLQSCMSFIFSTLSNFGLILAVVWCSISVLNGNTDYGSILSVILLLQQLQHPFSAFSSLLPAYYGQIASGERLSEIDEIPCERIAEQEKDVTTLYNDFTAIFWKDVDFTYGRNPVFSKTDALFKKGEIICLTGPSGAGKSTVFKLLLNVYECTNGEIGLQIEDKTVALTAQERGLFAYVPQGNFLFSGTIYENLTFFTTDKNDPSISDRLKMAVDAACADFVWELPEGLETKLNEGGAGLSEGQLQRLAIARALLSDRSILLLDEATSALDGETEKQVLENIKNLNGKTCLIVTHRPAALAIADRILHVEDGQIVDVK